MAAITTTRVKQNTLTVLGILALVACNPSGTEEAALDSTLLIPAPTPNLPAPVVAPGCFSDRFKQPSAAITGSVDLLFVTHTTTSFLSVRSAIVDGLSYFVQNIPAGVDYRIAVLLAHSTSSPWNGVLYSTGGYPAVLDSAKLPQATIVSDLQYLMTNTVQDSVAEGGEEGLSSLYHAMDADHLAASQAAGFFRPGAALAVLFLANEADICGMPLTDPGTDDDWDGEAVIAQNTCAGISAQSVYNKLKTMRAGAPTEIGAAVYTNPAQKSLSDGTEAEYGWGYMGITELIGGMTINLANEQFNAGMGLLGTLVTQKINLVTDFTPSHATNIDPASMEVQVDGQNVPFAFYPAVNNVHVNQAGTADSTVDLIYCQNPPAPSPTPTPSASPSPSPSGNPGDPGSCTGTLCGVLLGA